MGTKRNQARYQRTALASWLLYDAARLAFRNGAGPFRALAKLSFRPRAYQMVPLIMALRQDRAGLAQLAVAALQRQPDQFLALLDALALVDENLRHPARRLGPRRGVAERRRARRRIRVPAA